MRKTLSFIASLAVTLSLTAQSPSFHWAKGIGGPGEQSLTEMILDDAGNIYSVGHFGGTADFDPGLGNFPLTAQGEMDIFISKMDAAGNFLWAKQISGAYEKEATGFAMDGERNLYISGGFKTSADFNPGTGGSILNVQDYGHFFCKFNADGNLIFVKVMETTAVNPASGIALDASGNIFLTGAFSDTMDVNPGTGTHDLISTGGSDVFVAKYDNAGNFIWSSQFTGFGSEKAASIVVDAAGNIYSTGTFGLVADFDPGPGVFELLQNNMNYAYLSKLDSEGNFVWAKGFGQTSRVLPGHLALDGAGNLFVHGLFYGTADFDPGSGIHELVSPSGYANMFLMKLDVTGDLDWVSHFSGNGDALPAHVLVDNASGKIYMTGPFRGTIDFDPGVNSFPLSAGINSGAYICILEESGNFHWAGGIKGLNVNTPNIVRGGSIAVDAEEGIYVAGEYLDSADFDPGAGVFSMNSAGARDLYLLKLSKFSLGIDDISLKGNTMIYPNPVKDFLYIEVSNPSEASIEICNGLGAVLFTTNKVGVANEIDMSGHRSGIYFVTVQDDGQRYVRKVLKN